MAEDPLQQLERDNNAKQHKKQNTLLNEFDDLENNMIATTQSNKSKKCVESKPLPPTPPPRQQHSNTIQLDKSNTTNKTQISGFPIKKSDMIINGDFDKNKNSENIINNDYESSLFVHETHTLKKTILSGLFEDEYEKYGKLHNESAMLHCGACYVLSEDDIIDGEIHLTNFLLYFLPKQSKHIPGGIKHLILPIASIARIVEQQKSSTFTEIVLTNRIYRTVRFRFASDKTINYISSDKVLQMLRALTFPSRLIDLFAFEYHKRHPSIVKLIKKNNTAIVLTSPRRDSIDKNDNENGNGNGNENDNKSDDNKNDNNNSSNNCAEEEIWGWDTYDIEKEYNRMGIYMDSSCNHNNSKEQTMHLMSKSISDIQVEPPQHAAPNAEEEKMRRHREYTSTRTPPPNAGMKPYPRYRFTSVNKRYNICDSYPELFVVPSSITDWELTQVARFRRLGRIPILSWKSMHDNVALFRCSQPKVAMASNRSRADEHLIQSIAEANTIQTSVLYIMDARPKLNARVNKIKGGGFENTNFYKNAKLEFLNIDNIHIMRKSRKSLANLIHNLGNLKSSKDKEWLNSLGSTEWMCHIRELLRGTYTMCRVLSKEKASILCHCSDGWDRTAQLCSLVQLCLDSYFRTIRGFIILINKEWLSVGHQFDKRCGHRKDDAFEEDERSPIFEQFIECTYQLLQQYPLYFEFNEKFLICFMDNLYSCKFGTFLCDKLKQREKYKLKQRTLSFWTHLQNCTNANKFKNIYYKPTTKQLIPKYSLKILQFWRGWHLRNCPQHIMKRKPMYKDNGQQQIRELYINLRTENEKLKKEIQFLRKKGAHPIQIHYQKDSQFD